MFLKEFEIKKSAKNEIFKSIDDFHWLVEEFELNIRKKIAKLQEFNIEERCFAIDRRKEWFERVVNYCSNGLSYDEAVQLLAEQEKINFIKIHKLFDAFSLRRKAEEKAKKIFFCYTLKNKGFSNNKIAELLECSAVTVAKLLKIKVSKPN